MLIDMLIILLEAGGIYLVGRFFYRLWVTADIKQKESNLKDLQRMDADIDRVKREVKVDAKSVKQKLDEFIRG